MPLFYKRLEGPNGKIEVPHLGMLIGKIAHWTLTRRADTGVESDYWDLHAHLAMVNPAIFSDPDYEHEVIVQFGKGVGGRSHRIIQEPGQRTALEGKSLIMERVKTVMIDAS